LIPVKAVAAAVVAVEAAVVVVEVGAVVEAVEAVGAAARVAVVEVVAAWGFRGILRHHGQCHRGPRRSCA
jgi:hypothetical protein